MELKDLLGKPLEEFTDSDLEEKFRQLKKLKLTATPKTKTVSTRKSNKDLRIDDLLSQLTIEDIEKMNKHLEEVTCTACEKIEEYVGEKETENKPNL